MNCKYFLVIFIWILSFNPIYSQSSESELKNYFRTLSFQASIQNLFYSQASPPLPPTPDNPQPIVDPEFKPLPFFAFPNVKSALYTFNRQKPLYIFAEKKDTKGNLIYPIVAKLDLSSGPVIPLLFLQAGVSSPDQTPHYKITVLGDDEASFPGGGFRFINLSTIKVTVTVTGGKANLAPNDIYTFKPKPPTDAPIIDVRLYRLSDGTLQYSNRWGYRSDVRSLIIIVNDPRNPTNIISTHVLDSTAALITPTPAP